LSTFNKEFDDDDDDDDDDDQGTACDAASVHFSPTIMRTDILVHFVHAFQPLYSCPPQHDFECYNSCSASDLSSNAVSSCLYISFLLAPTFVTTQTRQHRNFKKIVKFGYKKAHLQLIF